MRRGLRLYEYLKNIDEVNGVGSELAEIATLVMGDPKAPKHSNTRLIDWLLHRRNVNGRKLDVVLDAWKVAREVAS